LFIADSFEKQGLAAHINSFSFRLFKKLTSAKNTIAFRVFAHPSLSKQNIKSSHKPIAIKEFNNLMLILFNQKEQ
jgi:hypothetical protein